MKNLIIFSLFAIVITSCSFLETNNSQKEEILTVEEKVKLATALRLGTNGVAKDEAKSFLLFKEAANEGNTEAQTNLAWMYYAGIGVKEDKQLAISWYTKSANQGSNLSKYNLAYIYLFDKNYLEALHWFEEASKQGFVPAWNDLGSIYMNGWGVDKNPKISIQYFKMAAENGDNNGQFNLGLRYYEGIIVSKNDIQAYAWFKVAGCASGENTSCLEQVSALTKRMTKKQLEQAEKLSIEINNTIMENMIKHVCSIENC